MAEYNPENPPISLTGLISGNAVGKDKYGISDQTGLGPNGADKFISYNIVINTISAQSIGDASVRDTKGLGVGGQYTGIDIKTGDWVASQDGTRIFKITEISSKADTFISCSVEDVGMIIARTRSDRANSISDGTGVFVFEVSDNDQATLAINTLDQFSNTTAVNAIQTYFNVYEPFERFTLYPANTGSISIGDLVTSTGSEYPYLLTPATDNDTVLGVVSDIYGGNNVNIRPFNKIITNFSSPENLVNGSIGSTWYLSGSGGYSTSSVDGDPKFFQITNPVVASVTGSVDGTVFDETQYNLEINGFEVIAQDVSGSNLTIQQITSSINESSSLTYVTADIDERGGGFASATTLGSAGSGGSAGTLAYSPDLLIVLDGNTGGTGSYPSAPAAFAITASGVAFAVRPTTADSTYSDYPVATAAQIASDINTAASSAGASVTASAGSNTITVSNTSAGTLTITNIANDPFSSPAVGNGSGTGLPTGIFSAPALEQYLALKRADGGDILLQGNWITSTSGSGLYSVSGTPPYLLMVEASGAGSTVNTGSLLVTASAVNNDITFEKGDGTTFVVTVNTGSGGGGGSLFPFTGSANITGSLEVIGFSSLTGSVFIKGTVNEDALSVSDSSGDKKFSVNSEGVVVLEEMTSEPTAIEGGIYYSQSQFFFGVE